ncbi:MAG: hypothetical protein ACFB4J_11250 [Elainellaceae cyanobacterium]
MNRSKQNVERLAILNAWVTSGLVLTNLLLAFIVFSIRSFNALSLVIFTAGTVGGAASNYRRLQEAYVQQLGKAIQAESKTFQVAVEQPVPQAGDRPTKELAAEVAANSVPAAVSRDVTVNEATVDQVAVEVRKPDAKTMLLEDEAALLLLKLQIFLSPIFGGLFAFVLYIVFISGIIQGEIFPRFGGVEENYTTPYEASVKSVPATNGDLAKAVLWAFVAGFAEGFVPNFIDKLVKDAEQGEE